MDATWKKRWVDALRGGEYAQGHGGLRCENHFCCLGVLCDIYDPQGWQNGERHHGNDGFPDAIVAEGVGLNKTHMNLLAEMNDDGDSFGEIADYIERHL